VRVLGDLDEQGGDGLGTEKIPNTGSTRNPIFCQGKGRNVYSERRVQREEESGLTTEAEGKKRSRVVSGMRPTGRLHIGHYFGALENWVRLQNDPAYECFYFIADWHALTSDYADTSGIAQNTMEIMTDYLAAGLDPARSVIFQQSLVPEHAELHLLLSMVTPLSWLERVPTYKEALEQVKNRDLHNYGFLGYPCLQTADIVIYSAPAEAGKERAQLYVPVGEDQVSHVELSREIVRRFNGTLFTVRPEIVDYLIGRGAAQAEKYPPELRLILEDVSKVRKQGADASKDVRSTAAAPAIRQFIQESGLVNFLDAIPDANSFLDMPDPLVEPQVMLTNTPRIPGLDGRKMSKSYGNAITLSETDEEIRKKTKVMVTDPARKRRTDPGNPDVCPVYDWHRLFSPGEPGRLEWVRQGCTTAGIGCIECKSAMADNLIKWIAPKREQRIKWENDPKGVLEIIDDGSKRARLEAKKTIGRVREAVFGWEKKRKELASGA
jgi:tryptophanyl-tRNA synthetase